VDEVLKILSFESLLLFLFCQSAQVDLHEVKQRVDVQSSAVATKNSSSNFEHSLGFGFARRANKQPGGYVGDVRVVVVSFCAHIPKGTCDVPSLSPHQFRLTSGKVHAERPSDRSFPLRA
jgi:hypothetical protein